MEETADGSLSQVAFMWDFTDWTNGPGECSNSGWRLRDLLEALPAALYTTDADGRITFFNQSAAEFSGRVPEIGSDQWCVTWRLYWPDGRPMAHDECPMARALTEDRPIRGEEAIAERPDGTRVPFMTYPTPLHDLSDAAA